MSFGVWERNGVNAQGVETCLKGTFVPVEFVRFVARGRYHGVDVTSWRVEPVHDKLGGTALLLGYSDKLCAGDFAETYMDGFRWKGCGILDGLGGGCGGEDET